MTFKALKMFYLSFLKVFFIEGKLLCDVVLVSAIQQHKSAIIILTSSVYHIPTKKKLKNKRHGFTEILAHFKLIIIVLLESR